MIDVALPNTQPTSSPHVAEFVTRVLERLKPLTSDPEIHNHVHEEDTQETNERTQAVKLLKTGQNEQEHVKLCGRWKQHTVSPHWLWEEKETS